MPKRLNWEYAQRAKMVVDQDASHRDLIRSRQRYLPREEQEEFARNVANHKRILSRMCGKRPVTLRDKQNLSMRHRKTPVTLPRISILEEPS